MLPPNCSDSAAPSEGESQEELECWMWPLSPGSCHVHGHHLAFTSAKQLGPWNKYHQHIPSGHHHSSHGYLLLALKLGHNKFGAALWTDEEREGSGDHVESWNMFLKPPPNPRYSNPKTRHKSINEKELKGKRAELKIQWQKKWHKWLLDNRIYKE